MPIKYPAILLLIFLLSSCASGPTRSPSPCNGSEAKTSRLFLQQISTNSAIIKWRGEASTVCVGSDPDHLTIQVSASQTAANHQEALVTGLLPDSRYYYSIGGASTSPVDQHFNTAPVKGNLPKDGNTRIWLVGDSGTNTDSSRKHYEGKAAQVQQGMQTFVANNGNEPIDMFVMLGDNAYAVGSDHNYQQAVFELYTDILKTVAVWSTIGNHEMGGGEFDPCSYVDGLPCGVKTAFWGGSSSSADPDSWRSKKDDTPSRVPYLNIFSLPTAAEIGGVASGTEQYYAFDYGNVHVVSLDSQLSARDIDQRAAMRQWLIDDLTANTADWTIVIFHHPPYSKGANHDSDKTEHSVVDRPQWDMRNEFVPLFDAHGVDVVYSGHSHSYERSYYLRNHTGTSATYSHAEFAELVNGNPDLPASGQGDQAYRQLSLTSGNIDDRVVYTVAGSSGKADKDSGKLTAAEEWLRHPAHFQQPNDTAEVKRNGLAMLGSVIIDAKATELTARFIDINGEVKDYFRITR